VQFAPYPPKIRKSAQKNKIFAYIIQRVARRAEDRRALPAVTDRLLLRDACLCLFSGWNLDLSRLARGPIREVQVFFYLPGLVAVFEWFFWLVIHLAERMFRVLDCLTDNFQRFGHRLISFFQVWQGVKQAAGLP